MNNVMLDLETLGSSPGSVIVSIGAVRFSREEEVGDRFYRTVDPASCQRRGLTIDAKNVLWWLGQSEDARREVAKAQVPIEVALLDFSEFLGEDARVWGNGATFDNVLLSEAYKAADLRRPWSHKGDRCYRTIKNLFGIGLAPAPRPAVEHNALDDAISQATHLIEMAKVHGIPLV